MTREMAMFRTHARKIAFALSLIAAAGMTIPAAQPAAAASVSEDTAAKAFSLEVQPVPPSPLGALFKIKLLPLGVGNSGGNITFYNFKIQADVGTLTGAKAILRTGRRGLITNTFQGYSAVEEVPLGTLSAPSYRLVGITCIPEKYEYCDSGSVEVRTAGGMFVDRLVNDTDGNKILPPDLQ